MSRIRQIFLAGWAALVATVAAASGAVSLQNVHVTNVGTSQFTVVWTTSEVSVPGLDVYSDLEGTQLVSPSLAIEYFPIAEGDPSLTSDPEARAARRALETLAINRRVVAVKVSGLEPGTAYFVRPRSYSTTGVDNAAALLPLQTVTTAAITNMVPDGRLVRVTFPAVAAEGMVALVQGPEGTWPLSMIVGDSTDGHTALIPLANVIDIATGTNALFTGPQTFSVRLLGADAPAGAFTRSINFTGNFAVAAPEVIETDLSSPAPFFKQHPQSQTGAVGATITLTVEAIGTPAPSLQWQRKPVGMTEWTDLIANASYTGVTTATLTISPLTLAMSGDEFRARAHNGVPPEAFSDAATLTVALAPAAPLIVTQPASANVIVGGMAEFAVLATGNPEPTYRWQRKTSGSATWTDLADGGNYSGTTTATLQVVSALATMTGDQFRAVASNGVEPSATSEAATLTVGAAAVAPSFVSHPTPQTVVVGNDATFTVESSGTPTPTIQWQRKAVTGGEWANVAESATYSGATSSTLVVVAASAEMTGDEFRAIASNGTLPDATSTSAALTVLVAPTIVQQPTSVSANVGANVEFSVLAEGSDPFTYQWQRRSAGTESWSELTDGGAYSGATSTTLAVTSISAAMNGDAFRCVVTNAAGSSTSEMGTITLANQVAQLAFAGLRQVYDGQPKPVQVSTTPAGLTVVTTYNGASAVPVLPGVYTVSASVNEPGYTGSATAELVISPTVWVRRAPTLAGGVEGSVQVATPEPISLKGWVSGDLLVVGSPTVVGTNNPNVAGVQDATGAATPSNYSVTIDPAAALRYVVRRVDNRAWPVLPTVPLPKGTRTVALSKAGQSIGDAATLLNLSTSGAAGTVVVPPGTYGNFAINGTTTLRLGVAGATEPAVYNLQSLSVNSLLGAATLDVVGPVVINVDKNVMIGGTTGSSTQPQWLWLNIASGSLVVNAKAVIHGHVLVAKGSTTLNGTSSIHGELITDRLSVGATAAVEGFVEPAATE